LNREKLLKLKRENELKALKQLIQEEFINQLEFVDEVQDIFDINGFYQKNKKFSKKLKIYFIAGVIGGFIGQFALFLSYLTLSEPEALQDDKLNKIVDSFILKSPVIYILYKQQDLQYIQTLSDTITTMEDLKLLDEEIFNVK
jgi:hypothetical protein